MPSYLLIQAAVDTTEIRVMIERDCGSVLSGYLLDISSHPATGLCVASIFRFNILNKLIVIFFIYVD